MVSQSPSGYLVTVTKSAVMNTLATPSISNRSAATGSSAADPATNVLGSPTLTPTVNFIACGFGVPLTLTVTSSSLEHSEASWQLGWERAA